MTTISVPINRELEDFIEEMIRDNKASNKAEVVRRALAEYRENQLLLDVMQAEKDIQEGNIYKGDLKEIMKAFK